jgi:hypothetical protein
VYVSATPGEDNNLRTAAGWVLTTVILVIAVIRAIRSVSFQLWLGSFRMNTFVLLLLQEWMGQCGAGKHDQWRGYMTILVINDETIKSISILTVVIRLIIKFDVDNPRECSRLEVKWMLAIHLQLLALSALDLDCVHYLS